MTKKTTKPKAKKVKPKHFSFSQTSLDRMKGVDQRLIDIAHKALSISAVDFGIPQYGGIRTGKEQGWLYSEEKTKLDGLVKRSKHQDGLALDVFAYVDGKASWKEEHLTAVADAFKESAKAMDIKIEWGGDWQNFVDMPHFEIVDKDIGGDPSSIVLAGIPLKRG